eukprot:m.206670 g.206670  ORF g.206670 m.206670 type:complete len:52 (-) comp25361_c0_seq1:1082-1237(-)
MWKVAMAGYEQCRLGAKLWVATAAPSARVPRTEKKGSQRKASEKREATKFP